MQPTPLSDWSDQGILLITLTLSLQSVSIDFELIIE